MNVGDKAFWKFKHNDEWNYEEVTIKKIEDDYITVLIHSNNEIALACPECVFEYNDMNYLIKIKYDIDNGEITFSRDNTILKEINIKVLESPDYKEKYEIVFFEGDEEIDKIEHTGSYKVDTEAIINKAKEIASKL